MKACQAFAMRSLKPAAPQSPWRFLACAGAKNSTGRGPARSRPPASWSTWVPPMEQLYASAVKRLWMALRNAPLPAKSTYTQGVSAGSCASWS